MTDHFQNVIDMCNEFKKDYNNYLVSRCNFSKQAFEYLVWAYHFDKYAIQYINNEIWLYCARNGRVMESDELDSIAKELSVDLPVILKLYVCDGTYLFEIGMPYEVQEIPIFEFKPKLPRMPAWQEFPDLANFYYSIWFPEEC